VVYRPRDIKVSETTRPEDQAYDPCRMQKCRSVCGGLLSPELAKASLVRRSPYPLVFVLHLDSTGSQSSTVDVILVAHCLAEEGVAVALSRCLLIALPLQYTCFQKAEPFEPTTHTSLCQL